MSMTRLFTRVTSEFDPDRPTGTLVCAEDLPGTHGFSEQGFDAVDYDSEPTVYEVVPKVSFFASEEAAVAAIRAAGIAVFDTHEDVEAAVQRGEFTGSWSKGDCFVLEEDPINRIIHESAQVRMALEAAGILAVRDHVAVHNMQPLLTILWRPDTFELHGPLPIKVMGNPQDVVLADHPENASAAPRF
jgi:hypothetical protein